MDISVVVPVYNVERFLDNCIKSIIKQDFKGNYEVICVNDGSTDDSLKILESYKMENANLIIIDQENKGLSGARNVGLMVSKGKYVMFLDSDDSFKHNGVLTLMYSQVEECNLDFVIADFEYDYEDKNKNYRIKRNKAIKNQIMSGKDFYDIGLKTKSIMSVVWNKLYRREFLIDNNLYFMENILYEDMEFTPKAYYLANKVKYIDQVIIMYKQREGSIMSKNNILRINDYFLIADSLCNFNKNYNSRTLLDSELYIYITMIKKLKYVKDRNLIIDYKLKLKAIGIASRLLRSNRLKYKLFGLYTYLIIQS